VQTSPGQQALIDSAGGAAEPGIRSAAGDPKTNVVDKGNGTKAILDAPTGSKGNAKATTPQ
jgi:hypothetical protein